MFRTNFDLSFVFFARSLIPLLGIDVWEHAYYLLRGPDRGAYVDAWWDVVDFAPVEQAFEKVAPA